MAIIPINGPVKVDNSVDGLPSILGHPVSYDVGTLCRHPNINKWAKHKPVRHSKLFDLTEWDRQSVNFGLMAMEIEDIVNHNIVGGTAGSVIAFPLPWVYGKPRGGAENEPFRLGDFRGYNPQAEPAITDINDVIITNRDIDQYISSDIDVKWYPSFKYGDQSYETIGSMTPNREIHLYMLEIIQGSQIKDENWRIGLAIWNPMNNLYYIASSQIPIQNGLNGSTISGIFVSLLKESTLVRNLIINMTEGSTLEAIPFIGYKLEKNTSTNEFYFIAGASGGKAFSFPEGNKILIKREGFEYDIYASMVLTSTSNQSGNFSGGVYMTSQDPVMGTLNRKTTPPQQIKITFNSTKAVSFNPTLPLTRVLFRKSVSQDWIEIPISTINGSTSSQTLSTSSINTIVGSSDVLQTYLYNLPPYTGEGYSMGAIRIISNGIIIAEQEIRYIALNI